MLYYDRIDLKEGIDTAKQLWHIMHNLPLLAF